jgi:hypothetical protein
VQPLSHFFGKILILTILKHDWQEAVNEELKNRHQDYTMKGALGTPDAEAISNKSDDVPKRTLQPQYAVFSAFC